jgi:hypothetical protein
VAIVEFQVNLSKFLAAQKLALQSMKVCTPPWINVGPFPIVIDRIEFGNNSVRHNVPVTYGIDYPYFDEVGTVYVSGFRVQIAQDVDVWVASLSDLLAHPNQPASVIIPLPITIVMNLDYYSIGQTCYLATSFDHVEPGALPILSFAPTVTAASVLSSLDSLLSSLIPTQAVPIDIVKMLPAKPGGDVIFNAGVSIDAQFQRIAFRTQIGVSSIVPEAQWFNFYKGFFEDRVQQADWGLFLEGDYLAAVINTDIYQAVSGSLPDQLQLYITTYYTNAGGKAVIMNDVLGIYDLPDPFGTLESNPHIPIEISVLTPNVITIDVGIPDIKQLIEGFIPQWAKVFLKMSGPLGGFAQALIDSALSGVKNPDLPPQCMRTAPANVRCTKSVSMPNLSDAVYLRLTGLLALDDGISLTGIIGLQPVTYGALEMTAREFKFRHPSFSCSGAGPDLVALFASSPQSFNILEATIAGIYLRRHPDE